MNTTIKVHGLRQMHRAFKDYDDSLKRELEEELREAGDIIASGAQQRFSAIDTRSAAGIRSRVKGFGRVVVEQRRRKVTGQRPDFGSLQMTRALIPSRSESQPRVMEAMEDMLDRIGRREGF